MTKIWNLIKTCCKAIFCHETVSKVWTILFNSGKSTAAGLLTNTELMNTAFEVAKSLAAGDKSAEDKKAAFNSALTDYLRDQGHAVSASLLNMIRETALAAVNAEKEQLAIR